MHNHIAATMKVLQAAGPPSAIANSDEYRSFMMAAGVPFLQAFQVAVRRACVAGITLTPIEEIQE